MKRIILLTLSATLLAFGAMAQSKKKSQKIRVSGSDEALIFSMAKVKGVSGITNPRFSYYFNMGLRFSQDINRKIGWYTGLELKNVGLAQMDSVIRQRFNTYYIGVPAALRFKLRHNRSIAAGGGVDFALHAKDKTWTKGDKKDTKVKVIQWFPSSRNLVNPYAFASYKKGMVGVKFTYYFSDYFSTSSGYPATNLFNVSLLFGSGNNGAAKAGWKSAKKKKTRTDI